MLRRWRTTLPEEASTGDTPQRLANDASLPNLSGLSPATITARCSGSEPMRTCSHERLLRGPQTKDSLRHGRWDVQGPGGSHLLREPLLGKALRQQGRARRILSSEE